MTGGSWRTAPFVRRPALSPLHPPRDHLILVWLQSTSGKRGTCFQHLWSLLLVTKSGASDRIRHGKDNLTHLRQAWNIQSQFVGSHVDRLAEKLHA